MSTFVPGLGFISEEHFGSSNEKYDEVAAIKAEKESSQYVLNLESAMREYENFESDTLLIENIAGELRNSKSLSTEHIQTVNSIVSNYCKRYNIKNRNFTIEENKEEGNAVQKGFSKIGEVAGKGWELIKKFFSWIWEGIKKIVDMITKAFSFINQKINKTKEEVVPKVPEKNEGEIKLELTLSTEVMGEQNKNKKVPLDINSENAVVYYLSKDPGKRKYFMKSFFMNFSIFFYDQRFFLRTVGNIVNKLSSLDDENKGSDFYHNLNNLFEGFHKELSNIGINGVKIKAIADKELIYLFGKDPEGRVLIKKEEWNEVNDAESEYNLGDKKFKIGSFKVFLSESAKQEFKKNNIIQKLNREECIEYLKISADILNRVEQEHQEHSKTIKEIENQLDKLFKKLSDKTLKSLELVIKIIKKILLYCAFSKSTLLDLSNKYVKSLLHMIDLSAK